MPSFRIHLFGYAVFASALSYYLLSNGQIPISTNLVIALVLGTFTCLISDLDSRASKIRKWVTVALLISIIALIAAYVYYDKNLVYLFGVVVLAFLQLGFWTLSHRGWVHGLGFGIVLVAPCYLINPLYGVYAALGYASHQILDHVLKN
jgi:hypothetical protein